MDHIDERRLMELALDSASEPQNGEATHLEHCGECRALLVREQHLLGLLAGLAHREPPPGFTAGAAVRFARATRARQLKSLPLGLLICAVVAALMIGLLIADPGAIVGSTGQLAGQLAVLSRVLITVVANVPTLGALLVAAFGSAAVASCWLLAGLVRKTRALKYRGR